MELVFLLALELASLSLAFLLLKTQNRKIGELGLSLKTTLSDLWQSVVLFLTSFIVELFVYLILQFSWKIATGSFFRPWRHAEILFGTRLTVLPLILVLVNPWFEELLVRAFVITEVSQLTKNAGLAIVVSVAIQSAYHIYQGIPNMICLAAVFTVFSIYYVKKGRILPVILAHFYMDSLALIVYAARISRHP